MYGASLLPRISPRLLFSMTIVNTEPLKPGLGVADVAVRPPQLCVGVGVELEPDVAAPPPHAAVAAATAENIIALVIDPPDPHGWVRTARKPIGGSRRKNLQWVDSSKCRGVTLSDCTDWRSCPRRRRSSWHRRQH